MSAATSATTLLDKYTQMVNPYTPQSVVQEFQSTLTRLPTEIQDMQDEIDDPGLNVTVEIGGTPAFGTISEATERTFTVAHTGNDRLVPILAFYSGNSGAFALTEINGRDIAASPGALTNGFAFALVSSVSGGDLSPTFKITALAADADVAKTGTLSFYSSVVLNEGAVSSGTLLDTLALSKTYSV